MDTINISIEETQDSNDSSCATQLLYNNIVAKCLCRKDNAAGCENCSYENSDSGASHFSEKNIAEIVCRGLLNCSFSVVPDELKDILKPGDMVVVSIDETRELAVVRETGELACVKSHKSGLYSEVMPCIIRKLNDEDRVILSKNENDELCASESFRKKAIKYNLSMKLVGVHFQFDRNKLFFFYTADGRVDFRELAKDLASEFKTRIELRQIGVRDEAKRVGGIGTCGREFCCSSFLGNFKRITTQLANEQNAAQNFSKLSGPCGKLKCCLSFEPNRGDSSEKAEEIEIAGKKN